jgi:hypothetical protein
MREYVHVQGPDGFRVFVDGGECGDTNTVIFVDTGTHIFSLIEDVTLPECVEVCVQDTSDLRPLVILLAGPAGTGSLPDDDPMASPGADPDEEAMGSPADALDDEPMGSPGFDPDDEAMGSSADAPEERNR